MGEPKYKGPTDSPIDKETAETEDLKRKINNLMQNRERFEKAMKIIQEMINDETSK